MNQDSLDSKRLAILGVPSSAGARRAGQEEAPRALREAGVVTFLRRLGLDVVDLGDLPEVVFRPDPNNPSEQNLDLVCGVVRSLTGKLKEVSCEGMFPVVLGGDCTITLGVVAGFLEQSSDLGLIYLDGDLDLNTPETTHSGAFDGMVTAHLLGRGNPELARIGPRYPLLEESRLLYFGYNESAGGIDPPEFSELERSAALRFPVDLVREDPLAAAREALSTLEGRAEQILVHFDMDVTDMPAVDVAHQSGLPFDTATAVLEIFLSSPKCVGLVVTEFNPRLDVDGDEARRIAAHLAETVSAARLPPGRA